MVEFILRTCNDATATWTALGVLVSCAGFFIIALQLRADRGSRADYIEAERGRIIISGAKCDRAEANKMSYEVTYCLKNVGTGSATFIACGMKALRQPGDAPYPKLSVKDVKPQRMHIVFDTGQEHTIDHHQWSIVPCSVDNMTFREFWDTLGVTHRVFFLGYVLYSTLGKTYIHWFLMDARAMKADRIFQPIGGNNRNYDIEVTGENPLAILPVEPSNAWKDKYELPKMVPYPRSAGKADEEK